mmetsp:Transcript_19104/g.22079  ORF Transcript_19104/g.22079 Transcript_19104/m.22079 type:complete len:389 (-) Transcript_19104:216-1382(-)
MSNNCFALFPVQNLLPNFFNRNSNTSSTSSTSPSLMSSNFTTESIPKGGTTLLIIDPQNDFHEGSHNSITNPKDNSIHPVRDENGNPIQGSLAVTNSDVDLQNIATFIENSILTETSDEHESSTSTTSQKSTIRRIIVTLDSHHKLHIAHPTFWINDKNEHPNPFTIITSTDIINETWKPRPDLKLPFHEALVEQSYLSSSTSSKKFMNAKNNDKTLNLKEYCIYYTQTLEKNKQFKLIIWPEHCLIGTNGHNVVPTLHQALAKWTASTGHSVEYVCKGENLLTEMYSVFAAEVPISKYTSFNQELFESINASDRILVAGQAKSHCVNYSVRHLIDHMTTEEEKKKVVVLEDCTSSVYECESMANEFVEYVREQGGTVCTTEESLSLA